MNGFKTIKKAPWLGAFFVSGLCLATALGAVEAAAFDENKSVELTGERLSYDQAGEIIHAQGNVEVIAGSSRLRADEVMVDLKGNSLLAEGNVIWADQGNTVYARLVELDLKTQKGRSLDLLFRRDTWAAWGKEAVKSGDSEVELRLCQATSCLREHPHYRMAAGSIRVLMGQRIWLKNVTLYIGRVPLLWIPRWSQSLKDPRPPIEIRPGYQRSSGAFVRTAYNYSVGDAQTGSLRFDWMDKLGTGYGLSHHLKFSGGQSDLSAYYTRDKNNPDNQSWTMNFGYAQDIKGYRLLGNLDLISQYRVNDQYDLRSVDSFQNRSFFSLSRSQSWGTWNLSAGQTLVLQPKAGATDMGDREYVPIQRSLPSLSLNLNPQPLFGLRALYFGFSAQASRSLMVGIPFNGLYPLDSSLYQDSVSASPSLTFAQRLPWGQSLSLDASASQGWLKDEGTDGYGKSTTSMQQGLTLRSTWAWWMDSSLSWRASRQLSQMESYAWAGLTSHRLSFNLNAHPNEKLNVMLSQDIDLLPYQSDSDFKRLGLTRLQASFMPNDRRSVSAYTTYHPHTGQLKTVDLNGQSSAKDGRWRASLGGSWVNNRISLKSSSLDALAPANLDFESPRVTPDLLLVNWRADIKVNSKWSLGIFQRLNLQARRFEEQAFTLWRDLHCWDLEFYGRERTEMGWTFGFNLTLRAYPQISASSNRIVSDLFSDAMYGY